MQWNSVPKGVLGVLNNNMVISMSWGLTPKVSPPCNQFWTARWVFRGPHPAYGPFLHWLRTRGAAFWPFHFKEHLFLEVPTDHTKHCTQADVFGKDIYRIKYFQEVIKIIFTNCKYFSNDSWFVNWHHWHVSEQKHYRIETYFLISYYKKYVSISSEKEA